jgi:hypothetical protein
MTRKDYFNLAYSLRQAYPVPTLDGTIGDLGSDIYYYRVRMWETMVAQVADDLYRNYANFNRRMFMIAAGFIRRPDGQMATVDWSANRIANWSSL